MQDCTHLSRFALVSTVFPMQKREKVHRLLYHSLCTNVSCAPEKDINDYVLLATPRKTKDPSKKCPLPPEWFHGSAIPGDSF